MNRLITAVRKPVRRQRAEQYILITLLSFAASVSLTRLFLQITGYPQLGGGELHIAHLLWGGLFLFISSLLLMIYANRWVLNLSAICGGLGVGLFMDEVGKFITKSNDYFYPPAAPIIYAFFLLVVILYLRMRKPSVKDTRSELYIVLENIEEVLDHDLDSGEKKEIESRLQYVAAQTDQRDLARIARELLQFIQSKDVSIVPKVPSFFEKIRNQVKNIGLRYITKTRARIALTTGIGLLSLIALYRLGQLLRIALSPNYLENILTGMFQAGLIDGKGGFSWFVVRALLESLAGVMLLVSAIFLAREKERNGITLSYWGLLISLTIIDLLIFYFDQFSTIVMAIAQFTLLIGAYITVGFIF